MGGLLQKYDLSGDVIQYLHQVREDILESLDEFTETQTPPKTPEPVNSPLVMEEALSQIQADMRYQVNVLVQHKPNTGAPVVLLDLPTYQNLVGRIEHVVRFGILSTDFTLIKPGALHQANGGYLIVRAMDILRHPYAWEALKRALMRNQILIEDPDAARISVNTTQQLEPEPIPLKVKVVLMGDAELYYLMYQYDDRFRELFRVKADFMQFMARTPENENAYAQFIATMCHDEKLPHFEVEAVRRVVDYGSWMVSDQDKLSTQFGSLTPLIYESVYYARRNGHDTVTLENVEHALQAMRYRHNQMEVLSQERIHENLMFIDVQGEVVGQINGLVVIDQGDHQFGLPSRVTARVFMGRKDVVQIDRESHLTGPIHDKGVLILQGYLGGRYAQDYPLTLSATLTFEQSYGGVEGDSASSTELYALLSALSGLPIRQDLAVTGSVNQHGQIQPIGGATQKIEGFFHICKARGLTGTQGAIIPRANIRHLMLSPEVVQAIDKGQFTVYAIDTVDEGISLLTGRTPEEIHAAVDEKLRFFAEKLVEFEERHRR
jgi:lon-related putative ATP-dependent protease